MKFEKNFKFIVIEEKNKFFSQKNIILVSFLYRIFIFLLSKKEIVYLHKINSYNLMLEEKFLSFLNFEHTKPLAFFIKDYILSKIYPSNLEISNFFLISIVDIIAVLIYYRIILRITRLPKQSFLFASLLSISFVSWEYWRNASHFDHLNIFIFALFIHSSFSLYQNKKLMKANAKIVAKIQ